MFENIGGKIKTVAKVVCWIGIVASVIAGFVFMSLSVETALFGWCGLLLLVMGPLFSWIGSFMLYGFGQLIENTDILVALVAKETAGATTAEQQKANQYSEATELPEL